MIDSSQPQYPTRTFSRAFREGWPYLVLVLSAVLLFRRIAFGSVLATGDLQTYFYPYWSIAASSLAARRLPLWNTYLFAGSPLLANSQMGAFYPLNWIFWAFSGTAAPAVARALQGSVLLHAALAGVNMAWLAKRLGYRNLGALVAGLLYVCSGFLGVHVEHLNQLQALAWLPLVLLPWYRTGDGDTVRLPRATAVSALALILLAGHTQSALIAVVALVVWYATLALLPISLRVHPAPRRSVASPVAASPGPVRPLLGRLWSLLVAAVPFGLAVGIAAVQLLPTIELAGLSARSGGLDWREAVSFSLSPWDFPNALLPAYLVSPALPEGSASLGLLGTLAAAYGAVVAWRKRHPVGLVAAVLGGVGLVLALGGYNPLYLAAARIGVPGIVHFRAPARFLALYVLGAALLAGFAFDHLAARLVKPAQRAVVWIFVAAVLVEGVCSAESLPHAGATALRSYTDFRPATAYLVSAARQSQDRGEAPGRVLAISQTLFDPGDKAEIEQSYGEVLSPDALWSYLVAAKQREVLAPNLSMAFRVPAADGYDGGLLPLRYYTEFTRLFLPEGTMDGRLRENLAGVPDRAWLDLLDVRFVVTDKTGDVWVDGVLYDRQLQPQLMVGEELCIASVPQTFQSTGVSLLYRGAGELRVVLADGSARSLVLDPSADDGISCRASWNQVSEVISICFIASPSGLKLSGLSLSDERTGAFYPLVVSDSLRLVHSGDVKIYELFQDRARAFTVHGCAVASSDAEALHLMSDPGFDPQTTVVLSKLQAVECNAAPVGRAAESVTVTSYSDTAVSLDVILQQPGFIVLKDAWYPGWSASYIAPDATGPAYQAPVLRGDLLMRAVALPAGHWELTFTYHPTRVYQGLAVSLVALALLLLYAGLVARQHAPLRSEPE